MKRRDFVQSSLWTAAALSIPNFKPLYATARPGTVADVAAVTGDGREISLRGCSCWARTGSRILSCTCSRLIRRRVRWLKPTNG